MPCLLITIGTVIALIAMCILVFPIVTIHVFWAGLPFWAVMDSETFAVIGMMIWVATIATVSFVGALELLLKYLRYRRNLPPAPLKEPNLFFAYYRAAKDKVCPMLKFE
jgi:hypothetical protein